MAELEWVKFNGKLVDVRVDTGNKVILKTGSGMYFSVPIKDVYVRNDGGVLVRRTAKVRREGEYEV